MPEPSENDAPITATGLRRLAASSSATRQLDERIATALGATLGDDEYFCEALARSLSRLPLPATLATLDAALAAEAARVEALAFVLGRERPPPAISRGTSLHTYAQLWAGTNLDGRTLAGWLGSYERAERLLEAITRLDTVVLPFTAKKALAIEEHIGLLPEPYRSALPRLTSREGITFFTRYDELVEHLSAFRALFKPGATLLLVERNLDVPFERVLPIGRPIGRSPVGASILVLVCRGPGMGRLATWRPEDSASLAPASITLN